MDMIVMWLRFNRLETKLLFLVSLMKVFYFIFILEWKVMAIFEVVDPRGYTIICTEENWKLHILDQHPFMVNYLDEIKKAIEEPFLGFIYGDAVNEKRQIYYGKAVDVRYVKVVVEFDDEEGTVITAYLTTGMKKGEKLIWPMS
jgi:hypothetical protein